MTTPSSRSRRFVVGLAVAAAGLLVLGAPAFAHGPGPRGGAFVRHRVDQALDVADASPAQRSAIHQIGERLMQSVLAHHNNPGEQLERALSLFEADRIDDGAIAALRAEHQARAREVGDVVVGALREAHGALTTAQRRAIAGYVQGQMAAHAARRAEWIADGHGPGQGLHGGPMEHRFERLLAVANPTPEQRKVIDAAHARVRAVFEVVGKDRAQIATRGLALFAADRWDEDAVIRFRLEQEAKMNRVADVVLGAIHEVHDVLTPAQRKAVADAIRSHRAEMRQAMERERFGQHRGAPHETPVE